MVFKCEIGNGVICEKIEMHFSVLRVSNQQATEKDNFQQ